MPAKNHDELLSILQMALEEPLGIVIQTSDTTRAKMQLYRCRAVANDPSLAVLQIRTSPFEEGDLIICHSNRTPQPKPATNLAGIDLGTVLGLDDLDD